MPLGSIDQSQHDLARDIAHSTFYNRFINTLIATPKSPKTIMIVDDDEEMSLLLKLVFDLEGIEVISARNGQDALEQIETSAANPNLILSDITMPIMNGIELMKTLKSDNKTKNIPVIFSSAMTNTQTTSDALGASACIPKPYNVDKLVKLVKTHLH